MKKSGTVIAVIPDIANCLAEAFAEISDESGGRLPFNNYGKRRKDTYRLHK